MAELVSVSTTVDSSPEEVYALVSDLARMGEWSPEAAGLRWLGGATKAVSGARFRGSNRHGIWRWQTTSSVVEARPGERLSWRSSYLGLRVALWTYTFEPAESGGTRVIETTEDERGHFLRIFSPLGTGVGDRAERNRATMVTTLARLKATAESTSR